MAKIPIFRKPTEQDFNGYPDWFGSFFNIINPFIDSVNHALINNITGTENMRCEAVSRKFVHGVAKIINLPRLTTIPRYITVGYAANVMVAGHKWDTTGVGNITVTIDFSGQDDPDVEVDVEILVFGY